jgi:NADH dehydrogenase
MPQLGGEVLEIAGHEITTTLNVLDRMEEITGRNVLRFPIPSTLASAATQVADALSIELPISEAKLTMLLEENFIRDPGANAITRIFGIMPTDLDTGLRALADALPEQLPSDGVGELQRKRYWADIEGSALTAEAVMECFRSEIVSIVPIDFAAEPGASTKLEAGSTLTAAIPGRGHIQVRVEDSSPTHVTFATIEGHPLAGAIRFSTCSSGGAIRFQVMVYARAANPVDWAMMNSIGSPLQDAVWTSVVEEVVKRSGGTAPDGVEHDTASFVGNAARDVEEWARRVVMNGGR